MTWTRFTSGLTARLVVTGLVCWALAGTAYAVLRLTYGDRPVKVNVRWAATVDDAARLQMEQRYTLARPDPQGDRTFSYALTDRSLENISNLVRDPAIEDTHQIDRPAFRVDSSAPWLPYVTPRPGIPVGLEYLSVLGFLGGLASIGLALIKPSPTLVRWCSSVPGFLGGLVRLSLERMARTMSPNAATASPTPRARRAGAIALVLAPGVCLTAFTAVVARMLSVSDFEVHIEIARQLAETGARLPHFGYHTMVIVVQALTPADWVAAAGIVTLGGVAGSAAVLAWWLRGVLSSSASALLVAAALVPAALCVLQPVLPLDPTRYDAWLFGYFPPNQWHSPTTLFSKPFALLLLGLGPAVVWPAYGTRADWLSVLTSAALVVMSALVKPNFIMAFLPALGVLAVLHWRRTDWIWLGLGFALPAVAVLAWQYDLAYALNAEGAGVILAPLHVIGFFAPTDVATLAWRLVASVLFPLAAVACFPSVRADRRVQIGWATFLVGAAFGYLLAEVEHPASGNFLWSGQLAAFVLFAASAVAVLRAAAAGGAGASRLGRFALCGGVFLWHVTSGIQHLYSTWFV